MKKFKKLFFTSTLFTLSSASFLGAMEDNTPMPNASSSSSSSQASSSSSSSSIIKPLVADHPQAPEANLRDLIESYFQRGEDAFNSGDFTSAFMHFNKIVENSLAQTANLRTWLVTQRYLGFMYCHGCGVLANKTEALSHFINFVRRYPDLDQKIKLDKFFYEDVMSHIEAINNIEKHKKQYMEEKRQCTN